MQNTNNLILDSTKPLYTNASSLDSGWVSVGGFKNYSLYVSGLEADGKIRVFVSNSPSPSLKEVGVLHAVLSADENGYSLGVPAAVTSYTRIVKIEGKNPLGTIVRLFGAV